MIKRYYIVFFLIGLLSCSEEKIVVPITVEEQINLIIDLYSAETLLDKMPLEIRDSLKLEYRKQIATIHNLREDQLDSYLEMMQKDRLYYFNLQKMVVDSLKKIQDDIAFRTNQVKTGSRKKADPKTKNN